MSKRMRIRANERITGYQARYDMNIFGNNREIRRGLKCGKFKLRTVRANVKKDANLISKIMCWIFNLFSNDMKLQIFKKLGYAQ